MEKIVLIGGDKRMLTVKNELCKFGYDVSTLGLIDGDNADISAADVVVLPVPTSRDGKTVNCALTGKILTLDEVERKTKNCKVLCGGRALVGDNVTDYLALDSYCLLNAVPTAEGAIAEAIQRTNHTLWNSKVLVIGYGRVGKILCDRLVGMRCELCVSARKSSDFATLDALGIEHIHTKDAQKKASQFDIIFNTVDVTVFNYLSDFSGLLIDLSSKGCIIDTALETIGDRYIMLPSLPAKCACETAGKILAQTVIQQISYGI